MTVVIKKRCTIISNLLNNAIEACEKIQEDKRIIEFKIAGYNSQIFISVRNSYDMESIINQKQKFIRKHMWQNTDINMKMETNILHCIPNQENSLDISMPKLQKL